MPDNVSDPTNLKTQYATQVSTDLEHNAKEQERIGSDIAALQRQLQELERDHALLLSMQQTLTTESPATAGPTPAATAQARLPRARRPKEAAHDGGAKRASGGRRVRAVEAPGKGRGARRRTAGGPTLREIVSGMLAGHAGPQSAAEITTALTRSFPEREVSPTVVRNTLEALVAKGQALRSKQQKSVFYSAADATEAAGAVPGGAPEAGTGTSAGKGDTAGESMS
jgi:hypothetical protein